MAGRLLWLFFAHNMCACTAFCARGGINTYCSQQSRLAKSEEHACAPSCVQGTTRRSFCIAAVVSLLHQPTAAQAKPTYIMDENGEYVEAEETEWTQVWKERASKMQSMSADEVFMAGRGAGKADVSELSEAGKKRRALAGCRDSASRQRIKAAPIDEQRVGRGPGVEAAVEALAALQTNGVLSEKACTTRVLQGELSFILDVM